MTRQELSELILSDPVGAASFLMRKDCRILADRVANKEDQQEYWAEYFKQGKSNIDYRANLLAAVRGSKVHKMAGPWWEAANLLEDLDDE